MPNHKKAKAARRAKKARAKSAITSDTATRAHGNTPTSDTATRAHVNTPLCWASYGGIVDPTGVLVPRAELAGAFGGMQATAGAFGSVRERLGACERVVAGEDGRLAVSSRGMDALAGAVGATLEMMRARQWRVDPADVSVGQLSPPEWLASSHTTTLRLGEAPLVGPALSGAGGGAAGSAVAAVPPAPPQAPAGGSSAGASVTRWLSYCCVHPAEAPKVMVRGMLVDDMREGGGTAPRDLARCFESLVRLVAGVTVWTTHGGVALRFEGEVGALHAIVVKGFMHACRSGGLCCAVTAANGMSHPIGAKFVVPEPRVSADPVPWVADPAVEKVQLGPESTASMALRS